MCMCLCVCVCVCVCVFVSLFMCLCGSEESSKTLMLQVSLVEFYEKDNLH